MVRALGAAMGLAVIVAASCSSNESTIVVTVEQDGRTLEVQAEVADSPQERFRGLRGRPRLEPGQGMVFLFDDVVERTFTMEGVLIPLDLLVVRRGRLVEVIEMDLCPPNRSGCLYRTMPADAAVEVPGGAAAAAEISAGALVDIPRLS